MMNSASDRTASLCMPGTACTMAFHAVPAGDNPAEKHSGIFRMPRTCKASQSEAGCCLSRLSSGKCTETVRGILDFELFRNGPEFHSSFHIREDTRHTLFTDKMEFHVIELPKLPDRAKDESSGILLWARFINSERKEDFDMLAEKDPYIRSAYQRLKVISQDRDKRMEYEARERAIRDHNQFLKEADAHGEQRGIERVCRLQELLIENERYDDLARSSKDAALREALFDEFGI